MFCIVQVCLEWSWATLHNWSRCFIHSPGLFCIIFQSVTNSPGQWPTCSRCFVSYSPGLVQVCCRYISETPSVIPLEEHERPKNTMTQEKAVPRLHIKGVLFLIRL